MTLKVLLPEEVLLCVDVQKVVCDTTEGARGVLPRHIDFVAELVPGILSYTTEAGESFVAMDEGMVVKCGAEVLVSVRSAVEGADLGALEKTVRERFRSLDEQERALRSALMRLEFDIVRRFVELREHPS